VLLALGDEGERVVWHPAGCSVIVLPDNRASMDLLEQLGVRDCYEFY